MTRAAPAHLRTSLASKRRGFTLIELTVVMAIIVLLTLIAIPSLSGLTRSANVGAAQTMLRSLFASARAIAANSQEYVGVRFQQDRFGRSWAVMLRTVKTGGVTGDNYQNYSNGCPIDPQKPACGGTDMNDFHYPAADINAATCKSECDYVSMVADSNNAPIRLPKGLEFAAGTISADTDMVNIDPTSNDPLNWRLTDNTSFTVVFSPTGQIVRKRVFVGQRGYVKPSVDWCGDRASTNYDGVSQRHDTVFNYHFNVDPSLIHTCDISESAREELPFMWPDLGHSDYNIVLPEVSQNSMWIYERQKRIDAGAAPFTGYVGTQGLYVRLNVYTGSLINAQQD